MQTEISTNFLSALLAESEAHEEKQTAAYFDLIIMEVAKIDNQISANFTECDREIEIIRQWTLKRNSTLQERSNLLKLKLESFIRTEGKRTIDLPHGELKIRKLVDKIEIADMEVFLANADSQMVTVVPETVKPDLTKIKSWIKMTTKIPAGVNLIEGSEKFSLTLRNNNLADKEEE